MHHFTQNLHQLPSGERIHAAIPSLEQRDQCITGWIFGSDDYFNGLETNMNLDLNQTSKFSLFVLKMCFRNQIIPRNSILLWSIFLSRLNTSAAACLPDERDPTQTLM